MWGYIDPSVYGKATIRGNTISGVATGISILSADNVTVEQNTISQVGVGVKVQESGATFDPSLIEIHKNKFISADTFAVENATATIVDAENNYWGAVSGPGPVGPATGATVSTNVDYQPWCNADFSRCSYYPMGTISMQTSGTPAEVGDIVTMDSLVTVDGVYGMQLRVSFDATQLEFQAAGSLHNDVSAAGWFWDTVPENFVAVDGGRRLSGSMSAHPNPATLTGQSVATWKFKCLEGRHLEPNLRSDAQVWHLPGDEGWIHHPGQPGGWECKMSGGDGIGGRVHHAPGPATHQSGSGGLARRRCEADVRGHRRRRV